MNPKEFEVVIMNLNSCGDIPEKYFGQFFLENLFFIFIIIIIDHCDDIM